MDNSLVTFQELVIKGSKSDLDNFFRDLTDELKLEGWTRNIGEEKAYESSSIFIKIIITPFLEGDLKARIFLSVVGKAQNRYEITNIIPLNKPSLDYDEYNRILNTFYDLFIKNKSKKYNLDVELSDPKISLNEYLSDESIKLLKDFSHLANKNTGSAHPSDRRRWNRFVLSVFKAGEELPPSFLGRWLREVDGWENYAAQELVIEFERELDLLRQYNEESAKEIVAT